MKTPLIAALLMALAPAASAADLTGACDLRFAATSTLHDFSGTVRCQPFIVPIVKEGGSRAVIPAVEIDVLVSEMDTGNRKRNRQMREMFQADTYPRIRVILKDVDTDRIREEMRRNPEGKGALDLTLRIRDVDHLVAAVVGGLAESAGQVLFKVEFPVSLKRYDLKPPTVLGFIRVSDQVTVAATVKLEGMVPRPYNP